MPAASPSPPRRPRRSSGRARGRAPRRGSRARSQPQRPWYHPLAHGDRVYLVLLLALLVLAVVAASGSYADYTVATGRVAELSRTQDDLTAAVEALASEEARLQDPAALEEIARGELGLVRPGEIPYIVTNPATEDPTHLSGVVAPQPVAEPDPPWFARVIETVRDFFR